MKKVTVGMSGGIDSSVAACLLKNEGYEVTGLTFSAVQEQGSKKCCSIEEIHSAAKVCDFLKIEHKVVDLKDIFQAKIIQYFIESYKRGLTPNPCILCNRYIKFGALLEYAMSKGSDYFATGHYARLKEENGDFYVQKALDPDKDQSYFLSYLEKEKLNQIRLPLGSFKKSEVRKIAEKEGLPIDPHKTESQDICFIRDDYRDFLLAWGIRETPGDFIYHQKKIGTHRGIPFYSFGQRRGLQIAAGKRVFVREFELENNRVVLGDKPLTKNFSLDAFNLFKKNFEDGEYLIQVRYQSEMLEGHVKRAGDELFIELRKPYEIIAPGQFAVIYKKDLVYASGVIRQIQLIQ